MATTDDLEILRWMAPIAWQRAELFLTQLAAQQGIPERAPESPTSVESAPAAESINSEPVQSKPVARYKPWMRYIP